LFLAGHWWLTPIILDTQEAEIRIVCKTLSQKNPSQKRAGGVAPGVGLEFKPQYHKTKNLFLVISENTDQT
jgi:hypothetical protein